MNQNGTMPEPGSSKSRFKLSGHALYQVCGGVLLLVLAAFLVFPNYIGLGEDSYITFRYAVSAAAGDGLTFNPGEYVEGFSNPLWLFLILIGLKTGFGMIGYVHFLTLVISAVILILVWIMGHCEQDRGILLSMMPAVLLVVHYCFVHFAMIGLETHLLALLLTLTAFLISARKWAWASVLLGLAAWTRPEGFAFFIIMTGFLELWALLKKEKINRLGWYLPALVLIVSLFTWRWFYFHEIFPNTYYAKNVNPVNVNQKLKGLRRVADFLFTGFRPLLWLPVIGLFLKRPVSFRVMVFLVLIITDLLFVIYVGGDFTPLFRYIAPVLPLIMFLIVEGIVGISERLRKYSWHWPVVAAVCLISFVGSLGFFGWHQGGPVLVGPANYLKSGEYRARIKLQWRDTRPLDTINALVGTWINDRLPADTYIATGQIGMLPFYAERKTLDLFGLADHYIARNGRFKYDYLINERAPDYFFMEFRPNLKTLWPHRLVNSEEFSSHYELIRIFTMEGDPLTAKRYICYKRRTKPVKPPKNRPPLQERLDDFMNDEKRSIKFKEAIDLAVKVELELHKKDNADKSKIKDHCDQLLNLDSKNPYALKVLNSL